MCVEISLLCDVWVIMGETTETYFTTHRRDSKNGLDTGMDQIYKFVSCTLGYMLERL